MGGDKDEHTAERFLLMAANSGNTAAPAVWYRLVYSLPLSPSQSLSIPLNASQSLSVPQRIKYLRAYTY